MDLEAPHLRYTLMAEEHPPSPERKDNTLLLRRLRVTSFRECGTAMRV